MSRRMKKSGIPGIDDIPTQWETCPMKTIFTFSKGLSITKDDLTDDGVAVLSYGQIHSKTNPKVSTPIEFLRYLQKDKAKKQSLTNVGDFIFADTSEDRDGCGNCNYIDIEGIYAGYHTIIARPKIKQNNKYFGYLFTTDAWRFQIRRELTEVKLYSVSQKVLKNTVLLLPSDNEQRQIVSFLDRKCSAIDTAIVRTKESIEKLEEYKKAVITKAVTKGLNSDAKMRDSGVEWIGEVPETWEVIKTKYLFRILKRIAGKEGFDVISITQNGLKIKDIKSNEGQLAENYSNYQHVYPGDFAMNHMDLLTGWVDLSSLTGVTSPDYRVFRRIKATTNNEYYKYVFQSLYFNKIYYGMAQGVAEVGRKRLQAPAFKELKLPYPSVDEQSEIVSYINDKCSTIDALIAKKQQVIKKWEEYKKSLIYYAVTGKIDCRNEAV